MYLNPDKIIDAIALQYNVNRRVIFSKLRDSHTAECRQMAIYFIFCYSKCTTQDIAKLFKKNLSTVEYAIDEVRGRLKVDKHYKEYRTAIERLLNIVQ